MPILLASSSPRRKDLLRRAGIPFRVVVPTGIRKTRSGDPVRTVLRNALRKAGAVAAKYPRATVVGADTLVVIGNRILGKPADRKQAERYLRLLSGRTHTVCTGVAVIRSGRVFQACEKTQVVFDRITAEEIGYYVRTSPPLDKAGAYGIQEFSAFFVRRIRGDFFNVVGPPLNLLFRLLKKAGYRFT